MKKMDELFRLTHNIPKVELHTHLGGCFRPTTFLELAEKKKIDTDHIDFYNVTLSTAFEIFKVGGRLVTDVPTLKRVVREMIEDYAKQNTRYLEIRSTPKQIGEIESKEQYIRTVVEAIQEMESATMRTAYVVSINRQLPVEQAKDSIDLLIKLREEDETFRKYLVGLELSGDPRLGHFNDFIDEFERARQNGIKISLHCSEDKQQIDT